MTYLIFFGSVLATACFLAWSTEDEVLHRLVYLSVLEWIASNLIISVYGYEPASLINPLWTTCAAFLTLVIGKKNASIICLVMAVLFLSEIAINVIAFAEHFNARRLHVQLENCVFLARMALLGGVPLVQMAGRISWKPLGVHHDLAGNPHFYPREGP